MGNSASRQKDDYSEEQETRNCIYCNRKKRVNSGKELKPGDHIVFDKAFYEHHAIIIAKNRNSFTIIEASSDSSFGGGKAIIKESMQKFDFQRQRISVVKYKKNKRGTTIRRARNALSSSEWREDYRYHLFRNNCEHFARYCATGERCSIQVALYKTLLSYNLRKHVILDVLKDAEEDELYMYELMKKYNLICDNCFRLSCDLVNFSAMRIKKEEDVKKGDVICYKFRDQLHYAVILEVQRKSNLRVLCTIMHYSFSRGKEGTIREDEITIELNGEYRKLDYTSKFNVYTPDEVVRRAKNMEKEQFHERDFNDSRCFARWCKIKEPKSKNETVNPCPVL